MTTPTQPTSQEWGYKIGRSKRVHIVEGALTEADVYHHLQENDRLTRPFKIVSRRVTAWKFEGRV